MSEDVMPYIDSLDGNVFRDAKNTRFQFFDDCDTSQPRCVLTIFPETPGVLDPPTLHLDTRNVQRVIQRLQQFLDHR